MAPSLNIGVHYNFSTVSLGVIHPNALADADIAFIRLTWVDFTNSIKHRIMPFEYFMKLLASQRPGQAIPRAVLGMVSLSVADGFSGMGEYLYAPDPNTIRRCPYERSHASLMGWFEEKVPVLLPDGSSSIAVPLCPRTTLKRVVDQAEQESKVNFLVGFESEFILLKNSSPIEYASIHRFASPSAMRPGDVVTKVMHEIAKSIQEAGIELQMYHAEAAPGQYEIATGPLPPLESADALIHTREIIYNTAALHGLHATFAPRLSMTSTGNGVHAHISVHPSTSSTRNRTFHPSPSSTRIRTSSFSFIASTSSDDNPPTTGTSVSDPSTSTNKTPLTPLETSFLAGVLHHLPSLPALTLPTSASYTRVADGLWSGGTHVCWGTDNREAPVRLTNPHSPTSRRFEMRFIDGLANPYLALAGILGAGWDGIRREVGLEVMDSPGPKSAAQMTEEERRALGITKRMPLSWEEGRRNIVGDREIVAILGEELVEKYLSVNKLFDESLRRKVNETEEGALERLVQLY